MQTKKARFILLLAVFFAALLPFARAQSTSELSASDLSSIVQQCVDLPELKAYLPVDANGNLDQVNVLNYPTAFPADMVVKKGGKQVNFISNEVFYRHPVANYFTFRRIAQEGSTIHLIGNYHYSDNGTKASKAMSVEFSHNTGAWAITKSTIK